jgi:hypothetical protein
MKRKNSLVSLLSVLSLIAYASPARAEGEAATLAFIGAAIGASSIAYGNGILGELSDWADLDSKTTAQLTHDCGMKLETRLVGNNAYNLLFFVLKNDTPGSVVFPYDQVRFDFDNGKSRLPSLPQDWAPATLEPGHQWASLLPFPSKDDFKTGQKITVTLPILDPHTGKTCNIVTTFNRNGSVAPKEATYTSYTSGELRLGFGGAVLRSGPQSDVSTGRFNFEASIKGYPSPHWGAMFAAHIDFMGDGNSVALAPATGSPSVTPKLSIVHLVLGPSYRTSIREKWTFSYDVGPGLAIASYNQASSDKQDTSDLFSIYNRANIAYTYARQREGIWRGDYSIGMSAYDAWMPGASNLSGVRFGGNNFGLLGYFGFGF